MRNGLLTAKQEGFCKDYISHGDGIKAYIDNYKPSCSDKNLIAKRVANLKGNPRIRTRIQQLRDIVAKKVVDEFKITDVLKQWIDIATADPAELIQYRRTCCRYCYGIDYKYQWATENEFAEQCAKFISMGKEPIEARGGFSFNATFDPNPHCPRCFGEGIENIYITDTRKLKGKAKLLYAGLRKKNGGIEILMRNQDKALENIARYLGMFNEKGDNLPAKPLDDVKLPTDSIEAGKIYQKIISS